ncbi:hypothetical protein [Nocardioides aequoreus]|uniref:hypothetical protein n=1 Tax=Nocardioides aequoreus TaxID=397278 RepID=UPI0004C314CF|nr:hypothetical protein [Nocardioides aequoreus]
MPVRDRRDLCPGVLRPWPADDGGLVRIRLVGGRVRPAALVALGEVAAEHGDGELHLTTRANLQLRGLPLHDGRLPAQVLAAVEATGLLPSRTHELARNVLVSPLTGVAGGRADLRPVAAELDARLCASPALASLPGRFLFVLDDGRGDLVDLQGLVRRGPDLGLVALDATTAQLRHGREGWGDVVPLTDAAAALVHLAERFTRLRGTEASAPWHVDELAAPLAARRPRDPRTRVREEPIDRGTASGPGWTHLAVPDGTLSPRLLAELDPSGPDLVVTPWHGIVIPRSTREHD